MRWTAPPSCKARCRAVRSASGGPALENDIRDWIATWNDNPRPFTWTNTADEILTSLAAYLTKLGAGQSVNTQE